MNPVPPSGKRKPIARRIRMAPTARTMARLRAVQALYQMDMNAVSTDHVIGEFRLHRMVAGEQEEGMPEPDQPLFGRIVRGVSADRELDRSQAVERSRRRSFLRSLRGAAESHPSRRRL